MTRLATSLLVAAILAPAAYADGPNHTQGIVIDSDDYYEVATGTVDANGCGQVDIWLSTSGFPMDPEDRDTSWYGAPDLTLVTATCEADFGFNVVAADNDTLVVLLSEESGYVLSASALAGLSGSVDIAQLASSSSVDAINDLTGLSLPDTSAACEPCCGPAPCCETGSSGGGVTVKIPIRIKHGT